VDAAYLVTLAAQARVTDLDVRAHAQQLVCSWRFNGQRFGSLLRPDAAALHVTEVAGSLRSSFVLTAQGRFWGVDVELVQWLDTQPAAASLAPLYGATVPWLAQARPRGQATRLACLDVTGDPFRAALAVFGAVGSVLLRGATWPEQPFAIPCEADALYDGTVVPQGLQAQGYGATEQALREMARAQVALQSQLAPQAQGSEDQRFNEAFRLIPNRQFAEAIAAFEVLERAFPHRAGDCRSQRGAALYFLGRYEEALADYRTALQLGADARMMNDNIREAEEAIRKRSGR
jgi:tetratricopeptide (TPR) repeat protein